MKSKEVGDRIKKILKENQVTQRDLAKSIGMTQSVISDILNGRRDYEKFINLLSQKYGWSRDYLTTGEVNNRADIIANSDIPNSGLSTEEKVRLLNNLEELYRKHQALLDDASKVMKEIAAINRILIVSTT